MKNQRVWQGFRLSMQHKVVEKRFHRIIQFTHLQNCQNCWRTWQQLQVDSESVGRFWGYCQGEVFSGQIDDMAIPQGSALSIRNCL